ncbi:MAG: winged helix-turn-helix domain-containing protein [Candidatus Tectomicrobia bacterium]|nr:winged helix-turn-helix domain-containing protein [Candidatus Tectomicrobia bacterium]
MLILARVKAALRRSGGRSEVETGVAAYEDVHITALRRKLGNAGTAIETISGIGYRLRTPEVPA